MIARVKARPGRGTADALRCRSSRRSGTGSRRTSCERDPEARLAVPCVDALASRTHGARRSCRRRLAGRRRRRCVVAPLRSTVTATSSPGPVRLHQRDRPRRRRRRACRRPRATWSPTQLAVRRHAAAHLDRRQALRRVGLHRVAEARRARRTSRRSATASISSVLNADVLGVARGTDDVARASRRRWSGSSHDVTHSPDVRVVRRHAHGEEQDVARRARRSARRRSCTTESSSGVAEPGEMITYGQVDEEARRSTTTSEQHPERPTATTATTVRRRLRVGSRRRRRGAADRGIGSVIRLAVGSVLAVMTLRRVATRYRGRAVNRHTGPQPAMPTRRFGARPAPNFGVRAPRRGFGAGPGRAAHRVHRVPRSPRSSPRSSPASSSPSTAGCRDRPGPRRPGGASSPRSATRRHSLPTRRRPADGRRDRSPTRASAPPRSARSCAAPTPDDRARPRGARAIADPRRRRCVAARPSSRRRCGAGVASSRARRRARRPRRDRRRGRGVGARRARRRHAVARRRGRRAGRASRATTATRSAREAAVAALGALGDRAALPAILAACRRQARGAAPRGARARAVRGRRGRRRDRSARSTTATGRCARPPRTSATTDDRLRPVQRRRRRSSSGSTNSSWSRLTCSVHSCPVQYRQWNRPVGSGYQSGGRHRRGRRRRHPGSRARSTRCRPSSGGRTAPPGSAYHPGPSAVVGARVLPRHRARRSARGSTACCASWRSVIARTTTMPRSAPQRTPTACADHAAAPRWPTRPVVPDAPRGRSPTADERPADRRRRSTTPIDQRRAAGAARHPSPRSASGVGAAPEVGDDEVRQHEVGASGMSHARDRPPRRQPGAGAPERPRVVRAPPRPDDRAARAPPAIT